MIALDTGLDTYWRRVLAAKEKVGLRGQYEQWQFRLRINYVAAAPLRR